MLFVFIFLTQLIHSRASFYEFEDVDLPPWNFDWTRFGMFSLGERSSDKAPFVRLNLTLRLGEDGTADEIHKGVVYMFLFPSRERYFADYVLGHLSLKKENKCTLDDVNFSSLQALTYLEFPLSSAHKGQTVIATIDKEFEVKESSLWYFYIFHCGSIMSPDTSIIINGYIEWKNPFGYLDGKDYPRIILSGGISILYFLSTVIWIYVCFIYRQRLLSIQKWASLILVFGFLESTVIFFSDYSLNEYGSNIHFIPILLALVSMSKQIIARVLCLLLTLGYSITRIDLTKGTYLFMFGICLGYFLSGLSIKIIESVPELRAMGPLLTEIIQFPGIMFNLVFFGWVFLSSLNTINALREHNEMSKIDKYHIFARVLAICLILSVFITIGKGVALLLQYDDIWWRAWWMWDTYWSIMFYVATISSMIIWRP